MEMRVARACCCSSHECKVKGCQIIVREHNQKGHADENRGVAAYSEAAPAYLATQEIITQLERREAVLQEGRKRFPRTPQTRD